MSYMTNWFVFLPFIAIKSYCELKKQQLQIIAYFDKLFLGSRYHNHSPRLFYAYKSPPISERLQGIAALYRNAIVYIGIFVEWKDNLKCFRYERYISRA